MPPVRKVDLLPPEVREELDQRIIAAGFGDYIALSEWLAERGYAIGKSTLGEHGQELERELAAVRASTQAALLLDEAARDDADVRSNAIYAQFQTGIFQALLGYSQAEQEVDPAKRLALLTKSGKDFAAIGRANIAGKKWAMEARERLEAARAEVRQLASGAGVSEETIAAIDRRLQGIV